MATFFTAFIVFAAGLALLGAGVLLGKRTPLKGKCHGVMANYNRLNGTRIPEERCTNCTCTPKPRLPEDLNRP